MSTFIDSHVHLYPGFSLREALRRASALVPPLTHVVWLLVDRAGQDNFNSLCAGSSLLLTPEIKVSKLSQLACSLQSPESEVTLLSGFQVLSAEKLELLTFGASRIADGIPASEAIARTLAEDGILILPWSAGKWLGTRGDLINQLTQKYGETIFLGEIPLLPRLLFSKSTLASYAATRIVVPGSDPLPLKGEERYIGSYGLLSAHDFDSQNPVASLKNILRAGFHVHGERQSCLRAVTRQLKLRISAHVPL